MRPYLRAANVTWSGLDLNDVKEMNFTEEESAVYELQVGDVLVAEASGSAAEVGKPAVWRGEIDGCCFQNTLIRVRTLGPLPEYLRYFLLSEAQSGRIGRASPGVGIHHIGAARLAAWRVPVAPLGEQQRLVAAIEEHLSRLGAAEAAVESGATKLAALSRRVQDELTRLPGEHLLTGDVAEVQGGIQKQPKRRPVKYRFPFLRVANVPRGELDLSEVHEIELFNGELERFRLRTGDLLVVEGNGSPEQIGRSAVWRGELDDCVHQNHLIRVRPGPRLDPSYLGAYWNAPSTAKAISAVASSTSGLYTLSTAKVKSVPLVVPPLDEQRRAVAKLEKNLASIQALEAAIHDARNRAAGLRRSILARAYRGELVPQDPEDEPASALLERVAVERAAAPVPSRKRRVRTPA